MIRASLFDPGAQESTSGGIELIARWKDSKDGIIWLDIEGAPDDEVRSLLSNFDVHTLAIQDALRPRHPPKLERFENFLFILLRGLDAEASGIDFGVIQLSLFVGERFLLTRHSKPSVSANWLYEEIQQNSKLMRDGPGGLALQISNRLSRRYIEILLELEPRLDEIEEEMFLQPDDNLLSELTRYKSRLRKLTRIANYHKQIAAKLRDYPEPLIGKKFKHEVVDLYEQIERTQSLSNLYYQISIDLTDGYLGLSSHRLNRVMQILTIITVIFVPLTFLAGIYGMNFENMPELSNRMGYFIVIGIMFVVAVLQLLYFRRKRWI